MAAALLAARCRALRPPGGGGAHRRGRAVAGGGGHGRAGGKDARWRAAKGGCLDLAASYLERRSCPSLSLRACVCVCVCVAAEAFPTPSLLLSLSPAAPAGRGAAPRAVLPPPSVPSLRRRRHAGQHAQDARRRVAADLPRAGHSLQPQPRGRRGLWRQRVHGVLQVRREKRV